MLLKQGYLVITGVVTAYMFTKVPEWTTWTLLIAMALYDLYAVLTPGGPLKVKGPLTRACLLVLSLIRRV
jgi:presenilin 1